MSKLHKPKNNEKVDERERAKKYSWDVNFWQSDRENYHSVQGDDT